MIKPLSPKQIRLLLALVRDGALVVVTSPDQIPDLVPNPALAHEALQDD